MSSLFHSILAAAPIVRAIAAKCSAITAWRLASTCRAAWALRYDLVGDARPDTYCAAYRFPPETYFELRVAMLRGAPANSYLLTDICCGGSLELVQWFVKKYPTIRLNGVESRVVVCRGWLDASYWPVVEWILDEFGCSRVADETIYTLFAEGCKNGDLPTLRWLVRVFCVHPGVASANGHQSFQVACMGNQLGVVRWLVDEFGIGAYLTRLQIIGCFSQICLSGHFELAQWYASVFQPEPDEMRSGMVLRNAISSNYFPILEWVVALHGTPTQCDVHTAKSVFIWACEDGNVAITQLLTDTYGLVAADARANNNYALRLACISGQLHMVLWLMSTFGLHGDDLRAENDYALRIGSTTEHFHVVAYIRGVLGAMIAAP